MPALTPFLWFDKEAEVAAKYYVSVFKKSKILKVARYPQGSPAKAGSVMTVEFKLDGKKFIALNGGPIYKISPAVSFVIDCKDQKEVDYYWSKLTKGGREIQCGWLVDKFGVSWQVVPNILPKLMASKDKAKAARTTAAMMKMVKLNVAALKRAAEGN